MKYKIRSLFVWMLVLLQCINLQPISALASSASGSISSSFTYDKTDYYVTVVDVYNDGYTIREEERQVDIYTKGDSYSYNALTPPNGYQLTSSANVTGVIDRDMRIVFIYSKVTYAGITVSFGEKLCNYLNEYIRLHPDADTGYVFKPDEIITRYGVNFGRTSSFSLYLYQINNVFYKLEPNIIKNISSFHTYYYDYDEGWNANSYYVGNPIEGISEDPYIKITSRYEGNVPSGTNIQNYSSYNIEVTLPDDTSIDMGTKECCHIVLDMDGLGYVERKLTGGVFRTVIDELDAEDTVMKWYEKKEGVTTNYVWSDYDGWYLEDMPYISAVPGDFSFIEDGVSIMQQDRYDLIYCGKDKDTNEDVIRYSDGTDFEIPDAPSIDGYKCINPDSPRKFDYIRSESMPYKLPATGYYYDYVPMVTYTITVKDKFVGESGTEEKINLRTTDYITGGDSYSYSALEVIPEGYRLVGDTVISGTVSEDEEIIFVYQKLPKYTVTVKDKYVNGAGEEVRTDVRQEDSLYEGNVYRYEALDTIPDNYELAGASSYTGTVGADTEIIFVYQNTCKYTVMVKDRYINESGGEIKTDIRQIDYVPEGVRYSYEALSPVPDGYKLTGDETVNGVTFENTEIIFTYQKEPEKEPETEPTEPSTEPETEPETESAEPSTEPETESETESTEPSTEPDIKPKTYIFRIVDEYYDSDGNVVKTVERLSDTLAEGTEYECTVVSPIPEGYAVISDAEYRGTITQDTVVIFKYKESSVRLVTVSGYLTDQNGKPVANSRVELHSEVRTAVTDADGYYEIRNVEAGEHKLSVFDSDDETELVTCDLSITRQNQDMVVVTYKTQGSEVKIDLSVEDVIKVDVVLSLYKLEVIDKYYDKNGRLTKSELRESLTAVKPGTAYTYDALSLKGYKVTSGKQYSGTVTEDTTVIFTYSKNKKSGSKPDSGTETEPKYYTVTVVDNYYDTNELLINSAVRLTETKSDGDAYYYDAKVPSGYVLAGADHYSGFVHSNITLVFAYKAVGVSRNAVVTIIDRYVEADGGSRDDVRLTEIKRINDLYHYEAVKPEGYELAGSAEYSGIVNGQLTLVFTYQKSAGDDKKTAKPGEHTVTVIDKYITYIPLNDFIADNVSSLGVADDMSNFNIYSYSEEDGNYMYTVRRELRCRDVYTDGSFYKYNALEPKNYTCISDRELSGTVTGDIELEFIYVSNGLTAADIPFSVYNAKPTYPYAPEAKTGDLDERNRMACVVVIVVFAAVCMAAYIGRKRHYR